MDTNYQIAITMPDLTAPAAVKVYAFSPDRKLLATLCSKGILSVWSMTYPLLADDESEKEPPERVLVGEKATLPMELKFRMETKFTEKLVASWKGQWYDGWSKIHILISNDGEYISVARGWNEGLDPFYDDDKVDQESVPYLLLENWVEVTPPIKINHLGFTFIPGKKQLAVIANWRAGKDQPRHTMYKVDFYDLEKWTIKESHQIAVGLPGRRPQILFLKALHEDAQTCISRGSMVDMYTDVNLDGTSFFQIGLPEGTLVDLSKREGFICGYDDYSHRILVFVTKPGITLIREISYPLSAFFVTWDDYIATVEDHLSDGYRILRIYDPYTIREYMTLQIDGSITILSPDLIGIDMSNLEKFSVVNIFKGASMLNWTSFNITQEMPIRLKAPDSEEYVELKPNFIDDYLQWILQYQGEPRWQDVARWGQDDDALAIFLDEERVLVVGDSLAFTIFLKNPSEIKLLRNTFLPCVAPFPTDNRTRNDIKLLRKLDQLYLYRSWKNGDQFHQHFIEIPNSACLKENIFPVVHSALKVLPRVQYRSYFLDMLEAVSEKNPDIFSYIPGGFNPLRSLLESSDLFDRTLHNVLRSDSWLPVAKPSNETDMTSTFDFVVDEKAKYLPMTLKTLASQTSKYGPAFIYPVIRRLPDLCEAFADIKQNNLERQLVYLLTSKRFPFEGLEHDTGNLKPPALPRPSSLARHFRLSEAYRRRIYGDGSARSFYQNCHAFCTTLDSLDYLTGANIRDWTTPIKYILSQALSKTTYTHMVTACYLPIPDLLTYMDERFNPKESVFSKTNLRYFVNTYIAPRSVFSKIALETELFAEPLLMYPIVNFKWDAYGGYIWSMIFFLHLIHFIFFSILTGTVEQELKSNVQFAYVSIAFSGFFLFQEARQIIGHGFGLFGEKGYFLSAYNYFELIFLSSTLTYALMVVRHTFYLTDFPPLWLASATQIMFWIYMLLQFRVFPIVGIFAVMLITIFRRALGFLFFLIVTIFGFAHGLHVYLVNRGTDAVDASSLMVGSVTLANGTLFGNISLTQNAAGASNHFYGFLTSIVSVYGFLTGDYSSISAFNSDSLVTIYRTAFSFVAEIILLNILIAILNNVYSDVIQESKRVWLREMSSLLAEMEIYWMTPSIRQNPKLFPKYIFYEARTQDFSDWNEEKELKRKK